MTTKTGKNPTRGFWAARDLPTVGWLILALAAWLLQRELPLPRWLLIHLVLLGAVTHAILVWSQYFSFALTRSAVRVEHRRAQTWRLLLVNGGAALVLVGVPSRLSVITVVGAAAIVVGVSLHACSLVVRMRGSLPGRFGGTVRFYIAAAGVLIVGTSVGAWLAVGSHSAGLVLAHALLNVLGWIGLTVAGTVVTFWPTVLRTRADAFASRGAAWALPLLATAVLVAAAGAAFSSLLVLAAGLLLYLAGLAVLAVALMRAARQKAPRSFAAISVGMALVWWVSLVAVLFVSALGGLLRGAGTKTVSIALAEVVPYFVAGFALQIVVGALSYLIPVVLGGGPGPVKAGTAAIEWGGTPRALIANVALLGCTLPIGAVLRGVLSALYVLVMASFLPIMLRAMRVQSRAKRAAAERGIGGLS